MKYESSKMPFTWSFNSSFRCVVWQFPDLNCDIDALLDVDYSVFSILLVVMHTVGLEICVIHLVGKNVIRKFRSILFRLL